jgi:hypothetical protein
MTTRLGEGFEKHAIGQSVPRTEDPRLLRGEGRYTDDVNLPGQAYACPGRQTVPALSWSLHLRLNRFCRKVDSRPSPSRIPVRGISRDTGLRSTGQRLG